MEPIAWDEEKFSVGHPLMDSQHQTIIGIINKLIVLSHGDANKLDLLDIFMEISNYAMNHFDEEEAILSQWGGSILKEQTDSHNQYSEELAKMMIGIDNHNIDDILRFVTHWWVNHILIEDMNYKALFT
mgnify:CR=1 FL=1